jgi:phospholipid-binding lipoprotein MlaA
MLFGLNAESKTPETQGKPISSQQSEDNDFQEYSYQEEEIYDPLEKYNRKIFIFNDYLDRYFLEYVARTYRDIPKPARTLIRNFLNNISSPISAFNSMLQGKTDNTLATFSNFLINSTIGVGGLFKVAEEKGIRYRPEDFGQTLGHYGVNSGPFLMLPLFGPSSVRDFSGIVTDQMLNPASFNALKLGGKNYLIGEKELFALTVIRAVDTRESLIEIIDDTRKESFDFYATLRSAYIQKRSNDIKN